MKNQKEIAYWIANYFGHLWASNIVRDENGEIDVPKTDVASLEADDGKSDHNSFCWGDSSASGRYRWAIQPFAKYVKLTVNRAMHNCPIPEGMEKYFETLESIPVVHVYVHYDREFNEIQRVALVDCPFAEPRHYIYLAEMLYAFLGYHRPPEMLKELLREKAEPKKKFSFDLDDEQPSDCLQWMKELFRS